MSPRSQRAPHGVARSALAVVAGYVVVVTSVMVFFGFGMLALGLEPDQPPPFVFLVTSVAWGGLSAVAGGFTTATLGRNHPWGHALTLLAVMGAFTIVNAVLSELREPIWYQLSNATAMIVGVLLGAGWRASRTRRG